MRDLTTGERLYERDGFDGRTTLLRPHRKDLARGSFVFRGRYLLMLTALQLVRHGEKRISMLSVYDVEAHEPVLMVRVLGRPRSHIRSAKGLLDRSGIADTDVLPSWTTNVSWRSLTTRHSAACKYC